MAKPSIQLIEALEKTASKIEKGAKYQWGHMGSCNCGHLAQELTEFSKAEIHRFAMERSGDWNDQILEFCPTSGVPMDLMISKMISFGLSLDDLKHLECLSDSNILKRIPRERRHQMNKNNKSDVVLYLKTWAFALRDKWIALNEVQDSIKEEKPEQIFH